MGISEILFQKTGGIPEFANQKSHQTSHSQQPSIPLQPSSPKEKMSFWTPSKIALAALGGVATVFAIYRFCSQNTPEMAYIGANGRSYSEVCSLVSLPDAELFKIVATKLKVANQQACPALSQERVTEFDGLIQKIDAGNTWACSLPFLHPESCFKRMQAEGLVRDYYLQEIHRPPGPSRYEWLRVAASPTCTTDAGLMTKDFFLECIATPQATQSEKDDLYQQYEANAISCNLR